VKVLLGKRGSGCPQCRKLTLRAVLCIRAGTSVTLLPCSASDYYAFAIEAGPLEAFASFS
jgi:hypothetical protein